MARYSYNGFIAPEIPESEYAYIINGELHCYNFGLIAYNNPETILHETLVGWRADTANPGDIVGKIFSINDSGEWEHTANIIFPDPMEYEYVMAFSSVDWASVSIYYDDSEEIYFLATIPEYYSPDIPTATLAIDRNNDGIGDVTSATIPVEEPGWHVQARLRLTVSECESGTRSVEWYVDDSVFSRGGDYAKPPCDTEGTYSCYVVVTDTGHNGVSVTGTSNTVTVTVKDYDLSRWGTDDSEIDSNIITPYPPNDPSVEIPTIQSCGADAMHDIGENAYLWCLADVSDGGELSYEWYEDGRAAYDTTEINPPTEEYGKKKYFCVVTNTLNGATASAVSDTITITGWSHKRFQSGIVCGLACDGWHMGETAEKETEIEPFLQGVEIGRKLKAQRIPDEHSWYLYNGVRLPKLPEWDKTAYPYVTICYDNGMKLWLTDTLTRASTYFLTGNGNDDITIQYYALVDNAWVYTKTEVFSYIITGSDPDCVYYTNYDLLKTDGTIVLSASEPVEFDGTKSPVGYLYSGEQYSELPEWDKETYPYAVINFYNSVRSEARLFVSDVQLYRAPDDLLISGYAYNAYAKADGSAICYVCAEDGESFERYQSRDRTITAGTLIRFEIEWANHNIYHAVDDTLFLAASEPIPVYE